jgi:hypothetical protein
VRAEELFSGILVAAVADPAVGTEGLAGLRVNRSPLLGWRIGSSIPHVTRTGMSIPGQAPTPRSPSTPRSPGHIRPNIATSPLTAARRHAHFADTTAFQPIFTTVSRPWFRRLIRASLRGIHVSTACAIRPLFSIHEMYKRATYIWVWPAAWWAPCMAVGLAVGSSSVAVAGAEPTTGQNIKGYERCLRMGGIPIPGPDGGCQDSSDEPGPGLAQQSTPTKVPSWH